MRRCARRQSLALLATVFVLIGTFEQIAAFFMCTTLGFVALAAAAVFVLRRRVHDPSAFRAPGYPVTPALFVVLVLAVVALVAINRPLQALAPDWHWCCWACRVSRVLMSPRSTPVLQ